MKKLKVIVIGAGGRGLGYTDMMAEMPDNYEVVGVAEPIQDRREHVKNLHNIPEDKCFDTWEKILDIPKFADIAIISTMDRMHTAPAIKAIELKYDLLLEKPVAPTPEDCVAIKNAADKNGVKVVVCHVLRYTPFFKGLKQLLKDDTIGNVISIDHIEGVGNTHQSHSFVRGNWSNSEESSFMLLQKSCHDLDILQWLIDKNCKKIQSFGHLTYFTEKNAPEGAPERCIDGCPKADECFYNAVKLYYDDKENDWFRRAATTLRNVTDEDVEHALRTTQYGKCVFKCNNNVVDHQTVNMEFEDDITITFSMNAFNKGGRIIRIMGTKGEIYATAESETAEIYTFADKQHKTVSLSTVSHGEGIVHGHGGGDEGILKDLYDYITGSINADKVSEIGISCKNHMIAFAAEEARLSSSIVDVSEYVKKFDL